MINDGDRHGYKTRSSTGYILYTVIITTWMINDGDRHGYKTRSSTGCILYTVIIHLSSTVVIITVYNIQPVLDLVLYP
jgi:predicted acetyltransferase